MPIPVAWTTPGVRKPSHCGIAPLWTGGTGAQRAWGLLLLHLGCCCVLCPWLVSWPWPSEEGSGGHPGGRCWCRGWPSSSSSTMSSWILQILRLALSRTFWIYELVLGSIFYFVLWILSLRRSEIKCHCFARRLATSSLPQLRKGGCLNFPE